ncbi:hypothetical protein HOY82DRAFT_163301 [Tuber indicum]|nr:hypothetical protein HOY82DRAFT_163301 [Tuber indicum]
MNVCMYVRWLLLSLWLFEGWKVGRRRGYCASTRVVSQHMNAPGRSEREIPVDCQGCLRHDKGIHTAPVLVVRCDRYGP